MTSKNLMEKTNINPITLDEVLQLVQIGQKIDRQIVISKRFYDNGHIHVTTDKETHQTTQTITQDELWKLIAVGDVYSLTGRNMVITSKGYYKKEDGMYEVSATGQNAP